MKEKNLKLITEILAILVICLVSFVGVYKQNANQMENKVKGYNYGKDLEGYRELVFKVSDNSAEDEASSEESDEENVDESSESAVNESLTVENFEKSKSIIEQRLKSFGVQDYTISLDIANGTIYLQIPEDSNTDHTVSNLLQVGKFEIKDEEDTSNVFISNDDLKKVSAVYNTTTSGTTVYLQIEFNKNGKKTLKEISTGEYKTKEDAETDNEENSEEDETTENAVEAEAEVSTENASEENNETDENSEAEENEEKDTQKKIILAIDDNDMITTSFDEPIENGVIDLSMNQATTDNDSISDTLKSASTVSAVLNSGKMPLEYEIAENNYVETDISKDSLKKAICVISIIVAVLLVMLIVRYKGRGILAAIAYVGFMALYLLLVRYTNVTVTIESIVAGVLILALNYMVTLDLLKIQESDLELRKKAISEELKQEVMRVIPILIIAVVFAFVKWTKISTFGMFTFWGVLLSIVYNYIITKVNFVE